MLNIKKSWPNSRGIERVRVLHAPSNQQLVDLDRIPQNGVVVDLGMGKGSCLIDLRQRRQDLKLIGVSASPHEIRRHTCDYAKIDIVSGKLPHDRTVIELLQEYAGRVDRIFDTYGPGTYAYNPLHSLIFSAILLKNGGTFSAITGTEGTINSTVFGDAATRQKIKDFLQKELDIHVEFVAKEIDSEVTPGKKMTDLLVLFNKGSKQLRAENYIALCREADKVIGLPQKDAKSITGLYNFGQFSITMRKYEPLSVTPAISSAHL